MRVLIVDDESLIRMDLRDIIESCGHEVVAEGTNGVEALVLCKKHKPRYYIDGMLKMTRIRWY